MWLIISIRLVISIRFETVTEPLFFMSVFLTDKALTDPRFQQHGWSKQLWSKRLDLSLSSIRFWINNLQYVRDLWHWGKVNSPKIMSSFSIINMWICMNNYYIIQINMTTHTPTQSKCYLLTHIFLCILIKMCDQNVMPHPWYYVNNSLYN